MPTLPPSAATGTSCSPRGLSGASAPGCCTGGRAAGQAGRCDGYRPVTAIDPAVTGPAECSGRTRSRPKEAAMCHPAIHVELARELTRERPQQVRSAPRSGRSRPRILLVLDRGSRKSSAGSTVSDRPLSGQRRVPQKHPSRPPEQQQRGIGSAARGAAYRSYSPTQ